MSKISCLLTLTVFCLGLLSGCRETEDVTPGKPVVYVPVPPYKAIASRLAGDAFEVRSIVSESDDPHGYSPTPRQVTRLSKAAIFFTGEMPFERTLVEKISAGNSGIKVFSLTDNIDLLEGSCEICAEHGNDDEVYVYVKGQEKDAHAEHNHDHDHAEHNHDHAEHNHDHAEHNHDHAEHNHDHAEHNHDHAEHNHDHAEHNHDHAEHNHDHAEHDHDHAEHDRDHAEHDHDHAEHDHDDAEHDHDHAEHDHSHHDHELDPHVWLSPRILKAQATTMAGVLRNASPETADQIDRNLKSVLADLDALDTQLAEKLAFMKGQTFYVYHGAFAYFAQAYGLKQESIELGGRRPEPKRLATLVEKAKKEGVKLIFVQPQFDQTSAKSLAKAIGGEVLPLDPLEEDVFSNLTKIAETVGKSTF